jgi:hypothetical protein
MTSANVHESHDLVYVDYEDVNKIVAELYREADTRTFEILHKIANLALGQTDE